MDSSCQALTQTLSEMDQVLREYQETLRRMNNFNPEERNAKISQCDLLASTMRALKTDYILELKHLPEDSAERAQFTKALQNRLAVIKRQEQDMDSKKHEIDREQLVAEADKIPDDTQAIETMVQAGDQMQAIILFSYTFQEETQAAVDRMRNMALEAEDMGNATAVQLDQQMDQMGRIGEDIDEVHQNVKSAARTVKKMMGGACSDRCVIILLCFNLAAIAGVVAMYATAPGGRHMFVREVPSRLQPLGVATHEVAWDVYKLFI